jgi:hypothetical protein
MQFNPLIHTKEFLLEDEFALAELARNSANFAQSDLANDEEILKEQVDPLYDYTVAHLLAINVKEWALQKGAANFKILSLVDTNGLTVAHHLAMHQPEWIHTGSARQKNILNIRGSLGYTVAHTLATNQKEWTMMEIAQDYEVLTLRSDNNTTVAALIAKTNPKWMQSEASHDVDLLTLSCDSNISVAHGLLQHPECMHHEPMFKKQVLTLFRSATPESKIEKRIKLIAEELVDKFGKDSGINYSDMALRLISMGAAYVHSKPLSSKELKSITSQSLALISDCSEPEVAYKYALAFYSTLKNLYATAEILNFKSKCSEYQKEILIAERVLLDLINKNPYLLDKAHDGIFCRPGEIFITHLIAERTFKAVTAPSQTDLDDLQQPRLIY